MDKKLIMKNVLAKLESFAKKLGNILIVATAMVAGFFIGYFYWVAMNRVTDSPMKKAKPMQTTSVAINERNELLVIDRVSGSYTVFQDSVGLMIFNLYANKKYSQTVGQ